MGRPLIDIWVGAQTWAFETFASPVLYTLDLMEWYEAAFSAVEFVMLGLVQIAVIMLVMRPIERRWGGERGEENLIGVDRVYTALNKLGIIPLLVFVAAYPLTNELDYLVRILGFAPPRLESLIPGLHDNALASFLAYFVLYDFAAYWVHRAQHRFGWWWALHSLHHSQRRVTAWTDDRNHILDDLLVNLVLSVFAQFVGVQPDDFVLILIVGRLVESFSHIGLDVGFGWLGSRLLVAPRFHRLHHALADARDPHIHDHNFAPVFPVWDVLFGTARFDAPTRPTGVDDREIDADNARGWLGQQVRVLRRFVVTLLPSRS
ncbi:MAG TPA: sterol desaturase family protein [Devosiaceae bacterium]|jgi:sterol desaturase/sphingolipid hydroxylase (fatty acid hydroxylase superfamily)